MRFAIDPGHGGKDPGAIGPNGTREKDVNLSVAMELRKILIANGHKVVMTRGRDVFVSLGMRCRVANQFKADRFISIHCNAAEDPAAHGTEVCYKTQGVLATKLAASLATTLKVENRGPKYRDKLYVLNGTNMPAVLAELAFISNPAEEAILKASVHAAANAIAWDLIHCKG